MIEVIRKQDLVRISYNDEEVTVLLKDLTSEMKEMSTEERERAIQNGVHYSEMLPGEKAPSAEYEALYEKALAEKKHDIAVGIQKIAEKMENKAILNSQGYPVIISLARAGIPVGMLIKRYIEQVLHIECAHYAISIIRDKGIDENAMNFIYDKEVIGNGVDVRNFFFVDGWTGKGVIKQQLEEAVAQLKEKDNKWANLSDDLWVLADPANITPYCGTHEDYLLPSACLNSTVSGLTSRTILNDLIDVEHGDFHGAVYFKKFEDIDKSNEFIDTVSEEFNNMKSTFYAEDEFYVEPDWNGMSITLDICNSFDIKDYKKVKPGIGETTRVLLRRIPWKVLINKNISEDDPDIQHILLLCKEKNIPMMKWDLGHYKVCGIIKELNADA